MSSSAQSSPSPCSTEEGDVQINWNLSFVTQLMGSAESQLASFANQMQAEIAKIHADTDFVRDNLDGPHNHLQRLQKTKKDLQRLVDQFRELSDKSRVVSRKAANRIINC